MEKPAVVILAEIASMLRMNKDKTVAEVLPQVDRMIAENEMNPLIFFIPVLCLEQGLPKDKWLDFSCQVRFESDGTTVTHGPQLVDIKDMERKADLQFTRRYHYQH